MDDDRNLWPDTARLICDVRPRIAVLENVPALRNPHGHEPAYLGAVLGDLATLGYDAWWDCVPASAVGAHHQRDRLWIVAFRSDVEPFDPFERFRGDGAAAVGPIWPTPQAHDSSAGQADRDWRYGSEHGGRNLNDAVANALWPTPTVTDAAGRGYTYDRGDHERPRLALPGAVQAASGASGVLNPEWVEWLQGYPRRWTDREVGGEVSIDLPPWSGDDVLSVGDIERTNPRYANYWYGRPDVRPLRGRDRQTTRRLMALGNAWVPQVAAPILATIAEHLEG